MSEGLTFFNRLKGRLEIELTEPAHAGSGRLMNQIAPPSARIASLTLEMEVYENKAFRDLTTDEWNRIVLEQASIKLRDSRDAAVIEHAAPNGRSFTVRELTAAIEDTERKTRGASEWFGGIDVHHRFFEGIRLGDDGVWAISWGS
jgi:hypothetical protein